MPELAGRGLDAHVLIARRIGMGASGMLRDVSAIVLQLYTLHSSVWTLSPSGSYRALADTVRRKSE